MKWKVLVAVLLTFATTPASSLPCADFTHSDCREDFPHLEVETPDKEECHFLCLGAREECTFFIFDNDPSTSNNCRLYGVSFAMFILQCNDLAGPKTSMEGCNLLNPPDNSCQVYRSGECQFGEEQDIYKLNSWENCQATCKFISECQFWRFEKEESLCHILKSPARTCSWEFSPREPSFEDCDDNLPTTSTSTTSTTINPICEIPEAQQYGDWFCPASSSPKRVICHLECHPGYVSDGRTVIRCINGIWASTPVCVEAIGLISGGDDTGYKVEVYGEGKHWMLPNLPNRRVIHSVDFIDGHVILCGGEEGTERSCLELTPSLDWRSHSTTTSPRFAPSSVSILGELHRLGGWIFGDPNLPLVTTEYLSSATSTTWIRGHNLLESTLGACAAKINPEVFIITDINAVISYNVTSMAATRLQDMIQMRMSHGCLYIQDSLAEGILVAGGQTGIIYAEDLSESELYDLSTGKWTNTGPLTRIKSSVRLLKLGTKTLAFGGGGPDKTTFSSVDLFNMTSKTWSPTEEMMQARVAHAVTAVPPYLVEIALN